MDMANYALAAFIADRGAELHLVGNHAEPELVAHRGIEFHRVPRPAGSFFLSTPLLDRAGRYWARRIERRGGRVIVNGGNCQWGDANWVHYVHAAYEPHVATGPLRRVKSAIERRSFLRTERSALTRARVIFANSNRTRRHLIDLLGLPAQAIHTVYYGIDPSRFGPVGHDERVEARSTLGWSHDRPIVTFIGGLGDRRKGFDIVFEAWAALCRSESWDADLCVVGTGAELPQWRARAHDRGIATRMRFLGFSSDVPRILAASDALVHPARYEAYGLGVHEALCRGLPAIVSAHAGVAERYPPALLDLLLPDAESPSALASRLLRWRENKRELEAAVGVLARELRAYTWTEMAARMIAALDAAGAATPLPSRIE